MKKRWEPTINNATVLGHGESYFNTNDSIIKGLAHSSFINILGSYGILAAMIYAYLVILGFYHSYKYYKRERFFNSYAAGPFILMMGTIILSLAENVINVYGYAISIAYFMIYGVVIHSNYNYKSGCPR